MRAPRLQGARIKESRLLTRHFGLAQTALGYNDDFSWAERAGPIAALDAAPSQGVQCITIVS
jgi:hypothetical protein